LLKRLHLEPWTASAGGRVLNEEEKRIKLQVCSIPFVPLVVLKTLVDSSCTVYGTTWFVSESLPSKLGGVNQGS
jgi:hypothetical protein